ncbi:ankyrin repeat domain-containing protein [Caenimonas sp. SL110]|uniref:ankyrin repeat domain-containing protein n=1 Tax=Caenimonas sp. SL110 TaxID=1450524 RepID=UPI000654B183|nr:ankyrin repeat domain-containing protein [Caenimonas sp. SL110]
MNELKVVGQTVTEYFGDTKEARLARAAAEGKVAEVRRSVAEGANVNATGQQNMTPLMWAFSGRSETGMRALLEAGADPNQRIGPRKDLHPVWLAAGLNPEQPELLKVLLEFKGDPSAPLPDDAYYAPLPQAASTLSYVKLLVQAGADINTANKIGYPMVLTSASRRQYDIVLYALENGFNRNLPLLAWVLNSHAPTPKLPAIPELEPKRLLILEKLRQMGVVPQAGPPPPLQK